MAGSPTPLDIVFDLDWDTRIGCQDLFANFVLIQFDMTVVDLLRLRFFMIGTGPFEDVFENVGQTRLRVNGEDEHFAPRCASQ
jgi:hypothetical protein